MVLKGSIDFQSHNPFYLQLIELLKFQIQDGTWQPGDQIPSEQELCSAYEVSRTVVRQALRDLEVDNIITRRKGKGTFVAKPKISEGLIQKLTGFYQDMVEKGLTPGTRVIHQRIISATNKIAKYLDITIGTEVVDICRLRFINDEPIQLVTTYIPLRISPNLATVDLTNRSLYEYLENENKIKIARGTRYLEAVLASEEEAALLEIEEGDPLLMLDSVSFTETGQVIEYYHAVHRGDRARFEVDLVRFEENCS